MSAVGTRGMPSDFTGTSIGVAEITSRDGWRRFEPCGPGRYWIAGQEVTADEYERHVNGGQP